MELSKHRGSGRACTDAEGVDPREMAVMHVVRPALEPSLETATSFGHPRWRARIRAIPGSSRAVPKVLLYYNLLHETRALLALVKTTINSVSK